MSALGSRFAADHLPWTTLQLEEGRAFVDLWHEHGQDVELATLTYQSGEYRFVPEYFATHGWQTAEKSVVEMRAAIGVPVRRRPSSRDLAVTLSGLAR